MVSVLLAHLVYSLLILDFKPVLPLIRAEYLSLGNKLLSCFFLGSGFLHALGVHQVIDTGPELIGAYPLILAIAVKVN